jgi:hypothetical protein
MEDMTDEIVDVVIGPDGKVTMHVTGVDGMACLDRTEGLVGLLGGEVETQELTAEAYVETETDVEASNRLWR